MTVVGVTGHSDITDATADLIFDEMVALLRQRGGDQVTGLTCLARGVDQTFADAVLKVGGSLAVVIPARDYFDRISSEVARERCARYLAVAKSKLVLNNEQSGQDAYTNASHVLVDNCDLLVAVWDGADSSGTADAVFYAKSRGRTIVTIWPIGAERR